MPRHIDVSLNDVPLTLVCPLAVVTSVREEAATVETVTGEIPGGCGERYLDSLTKRRRITITFVIRERFDLAVRSDTQERAARWCRDGWLRLSSRPNRRIWVHVTGRPALGEVRDYTQELTCEFETGAVPYWEDVYPSSSQGTGITGSLALVPGGTVERVPVEAEITPELETLTDITISCGDKAMAFAGLEVPAGTTIRIYYGEDGILRATAGASGVLSKRTPASADDLQAWSGVQNQVTWTANTSCAVRVTARGWYE